MAIRAGRHGVNVKDIDSRTGRIKFPAYELPVASASKLGGVKVGDNMAITSGGVLTAKAQVPAHTASEAGKVLTVTDEGGLEWQEKGGTGGLAVGDIMPYVLYTGRQTNNVSGLIDLTNGKLVASETDTFRWSKSGNGTSTSYYRYGLIAGQKIGIGLAFAASTEILNDILIRTAVIDTASNPGTVEPIDIVYGHEFTLKAGDYAPREIFDTLEFTPLTGSASYIAIVMSAYNSSTGVWGPIPELSASQYYFDTYPYKPAE